MLSYLHASVSKLRSNCASGGSSYEERRKELTSKNLLHVYYIVRPRRNPQPHMYEGNHYLRLRNPNQPQKRLVMDSPNKDLYLNDFVWLSGQWEFQVDDHGHFSFSRCRGYVHAGKSLSYFVSFYLVFPYESCIYFVS